MGLTNKREEELKNMPKLDCKIMKSKDGRYMIHKTIITHIKPIAYYDAVMQSEPEVDAVVVEEST